MAEMKISMMVVGQCLNRRLPDREAIRCEIDAWQACRNRETVRVESVIHDRRRTDQTGMTLAVNTKAMVYQYSFSIVFFFKTILESSNTR